MTKEKPLSEKREEQPEDSYYVYPEKNVKEFIKNDLERKDLMLKSIQIANGRVWNPKIPEKYLRELVKSIEKQMECDIREFKQEAGEELLK